MRLSYEILLEMGYGKLKWINNYVDGDGVAYPSHTCKLSRAAHLQPDSFAEVHSVR